MRWVYVIILLLAVGHGGCKCSQTSSTPDFEKAAQKASRIITSNSPDNKFAIQRLTPEQYSEFIRNNLGVDLWNSDIDPIVQYYGVALGGVDFQSTFERDPDAKVQTLLMVRALAWQVALKLVSQEYESAASERRVFTTIDFNNDTPFDGGTGQNRFDVQLEDLYWRFYARPPNTAEALLIKNTWTKITASNGIYDGAGTLGWVAVVYALLSSEEFWHI